MNLINIKVPATEHLVTFLTVSQCRNVTHAADSLGRTQSAISVQIRKLEDLLGVQLFDRQSRGMVLTKHGSELVPVATRAIAELQKINDMFQPALEGIIRVGIPDDYSEAILEKVITEFSERHPAVEIFTRCGCTSKFPDAIRRMELDMAVYSGPEQFNADVFAIEKNVWAVADSFELDDDQPVPLALIVRECGWRTIPTDALASVNRLWKIAYTSENFSSLKSAIRAGLAVGVLPHCLVESGMRTLNGSDGFPPLPESRRGLIIGDHAPVELAAAMSEAIENSIS